MDMLRWMGAAAVVVALGRPAEACAPAPPPGVRVRIAEESAVIVWDAATRMEHFVRRATFDTVARDFGFLVPTPTQPELAEAPDEVFARLEDLTRPPVVQRTGFAGVAPTALCMMPLLLRGAQDTAAPAVRVLAAQRVAGYDAVVLEADGATALADWLRSHGYAARPALAAWLEPYVAARWKITAFKVARGGEGPVATSAVRMSFTTERPFFPYREPVDQREGETGSRLLRVFVVSDGRMDGTLGERGQWPAQVVFARRDGGLTGALRGLLSPSRMGAWTWLTVFEDASSPRPGTDEVYFARASSEQEVRPAPVEVGEGWTLPIPLDLIALGGGVVGLLRWRRRRARMVD